MPKEKILELKPIFDSSEDFEEIEKKIRAIFREEIYLPLVKFLGEPANILQNSIDDLLKALHSGQVTYYRGHFSGKFSALVSKELKQLGAKWARKTGTFYAPLSTLPQEVKNAIYAGERRFQDRLDRIDERLRQVLPEEISDKVDVKKHFDAALWKTEQKFRDSVKKITLIPEISPRVRGQIAKDWQEDLRRNIKGFTAEETKGLRKKIREMVFSRGNRYESVIDEIQKSYEVSLGKARFWARQETKLAMTTYKEARFQEAGVKWYKWKAVAGTPAHPTRPWHRDLDGKIFRFDDPPNTARPAKYGKAEAPRYNNPGQDFNCRCFAIPVVRFEK